MSDAIERAWNAMTRQRAAEYLRTYGNPALGSREIVVDLLARAARGKPLAVLDLGCGNGALLEHLRAAGVRGRYVGVDFSEPLLEAGRIAFADDADASFVRDNVETLEQVDGGFDFAVYSHVLEILACPEASLRRSMELARKLMVRFFEPPVGALDKAEIHEMEVGDGTRHPYLRRTMSRDYYRLMLSHIGCTSVEVYRDLASTDQVHVLSFG
jgi:ubiquinone/menaquinone biosynthesis C-methylase UbiE